MSRRASRADSNQPRIVAALRKAGCSIQHVHTVGQGCPDLVVGNRGVTYLLEIKAGKRGLNKEQAIWHATWRGQVAVVRTIEEAFEVCGVMRMGDEQRE